MKEKTSNIQGLSNLQKENRDKALDCLIAAFSTMEVGILPGSDKKHRAMLRKPNITG